jgi:hypothetical protein
MSSQQSQQLGPSPRHDPEAHEGRVARRVWWFRVILFTAAGLVLAWNAWTYLWPLLYPHLFRVTLPDEVPIEAVVAEFNADPEAAAKKYDNKRIVVVGKLVVEPATSDKPGRIYFQLPGGVQVPVDFFDPDDAGSVDPGDQVSLSGLMQRKAAGQVWLVGAGQMPTSEP